jgi:hypothetical protein
MCLCKLLFPPRLLLSRLVWVFTIFASNADGYRQNAVCSIKRAGCCTKKQGAKCVCLCVCLFACTWVCLFDTTRSCVVYMCGFVILYIYVSVFLQALSHMLHHERHGPRGEKFWEFIFRIWIDTRKHQKWYVRNSAGTASKTRRSQTALGSTDTRGTTSASPERERSGEFLSWFLAFEINIFLLSLNVLNDECNRRCTAATDPRGATGVEWVEWARQQEAGPWPHQINARSHTVYMPALLSTWVPFIHTE